MSSPHMSFRLNHYQIAKMLRILTTLEPNQPISSLSQAAKIVIIDWISKHSINSALAASQADIDAVKVIDQLNVNQIDPYTTIQNIMTQANQQSNPHAQSSFQPQQITQKSIQQIQRDLADEKLFNDLKRESMEKQTQVSNHSKVEPPLSETQLNDIDVQMELAAQSGKRINHVAPPELKTDSVVSTVTDFSPPKDWLAETEE